MFNCCKGNKRVSSRKIQILMEALRAQAIYRVAHIRFSLIFIYASHLFIKWAFYRGKKDNRLICLKKHPNFYVS